MKAVKYYRSPPTWHYHMISSADSFIPEKKATIFCQNISTFASANFGISTLPRMIDEGQKIFEGFDLNETEEQYEERVSTKAIKDEIYKKEHDIKGIMVTSHPDRKTFYSNIEFIDIEIEDFDKLLEIYNFQEYMNNRLKEILGVKK